jgi:rSAM/selenodomain-associated transferase 2/rSAM/selenodomain-associated transferase 1
LESKLKFDPAQTAIVMPALGEGLALQHALQGLSPLRSQGVKVIVVDGDTTVAPTRYADAVIRAPRGRAAQMNAGADEVRRRQWGTTVLLFLHVDTQIPASALPDIAQAINSGSRWGRFDVQLQADPHLRLGPLTAILLPLVGHLMNWRSRLTSIATGDQAIFVTVKEFYAVGGFAPIALMEDVEFTGRLKHRSRPACLYARVKTSARRWQAHGVLRTICQMWSLRWRFHVGTDPSTLAKEYGYSPRHSAAVAVLTKAPVAGFAKTRLAPLLSYAQAARLQRQLTMNTLVKIRQASVGLTYLWCAPDATHRQFKALEKIYGVGLLEQTAGDIGERMHACCVDHFTKPKQKGDYPQRPLIIVGTDCPSLTPAHIQNGADALTEVDVVLVAAHDGGYVLIGLRQLQPKLFSGIQWSSKQVMAQTLQKLQSLKLSYRVLDTLHDLDTPQDWQVYQASGQQEKV